jgi:cytochrome c oxidase accessory protein FixG
METFEEIIDTEEYRDKIATVDEQGKRLWVYPKKPKGAFHQKRIWVTILLLTVFFGTPFIWVEGHPLFLFNLFERQFILFGVVFLPQDFHLFALGLITFFVAVILFTVAFGRIWCGWTCPQTVFMEMIFRKIEYWIEGDANQQRKLNAQAWNGEKIRKKALKQSIFLIISVLIAHTAMAYLIGIDQVAAVISKPPTENWKGFLGLLAFTAIFYFVFAYLREQACIIVCPYGRLQGVLLSKDSIVIAYDYVRGEPRGKLKRKNEDSKSIKELTINDLEKPKGDCIDCKLCVHVCPTGIDIRNGTQLECVNCTACIDVCDEVMDKIDKPRGLIKYASHNQIAQSKKFSFTPRMIGYSLVLLLLIGFEIFLLSTRGETETTILRVAGSLPTELKNGNTSNIYTVQVTNKSFKDKEISFRLANSKGKLKLAGDTFTATKDKTSDAALVIELPKEEIKSRKTVITIEVISDGKVIETLKTNFLAFSF